ncbi:MAPEG family protein [Hellea balneolensis]|uniref:MAPEG family protein n=1 Tax=Hellea balneolensis TaxID=287478 RepID=UPI0003FE2037|nr:MAPEG family protein [Hellea balneolensis]
MSHFLTPALALIIWTLIMMMVMYKRRIPAMAAISKRTQDFIDDPALGNKLPASARWAADNFNHLHENPTIFYALMFVIFLMDKVTPLALYCAWAYVAIRIVHSLVQITTNNVLVRFGLFVLSALMLIIMALSMAARLI